MSNMSYCRFHNTLLDLQDCKDALETYEDHLHDRIRIKAIDAELETKRAELEDEYDEELEDKIDELESEKDGLEEQEISDEERGKARALIDLCREIVNEHESIDLE